MFDLFICMLPDYMAHDITKKIWKKGILKIWQMVFLWGAKNHFGKLPLIWYIFIHEKINFSAIMPSDRYYSYKM